MIKLLRRCGKSRHLLLGWFWVSLTPLALTLWKESLLFVILMSLYANIEASFSAHEAKKANGGSE